jgi:hypothetical protein
MGFACRARGLIGLGRPPAPRPPPGTMANRLLLLPVPLGLLVQVIVVAVEDHLASQLAGKVGRTPFLHDGNVPLAAVPTDYRASLRRRSRIFLLKAASIPIGGFTSGFPNQGSLGRGEPVGFGVAQTMFTKQVPHPMNSPDPPSWPRRAERVERTRRKTWYAPHPRFLCPTIHPCRRGRTRGYSCSPDAPWSA